MSGSTKQISASKNVPMTSDTLSRSMSVWHSFTLGFAVVSPVAGLYAIIGVQTVVAGGGWFAALAVCLIMQLLVAAVYAELSSQFPIAGGAYKWARQLGGAIAGQYAGVIYICSTIAMVTTTAYTGGFWLAIFSGLPHDGGGMMVLWGALFLLLCTLLNLAPVSIFNLVIKLGVYAEVAGSFGVALLLFLFFRQHPVMELFLHMGTGTAPSEMAAFLAALAISGWAFIGFDACSTTAEETHQPKRMVPRAIFMSLLVVGTVVLFNSAALILAFEHDTLRNSSHTADPVTPLIASSIGDWFEKPFLAIVMTAFLACGASMVKYTSRIVFSMAREGNMPAVLSQVTASKTPRNAVLFTVLLAGCGLIFGLNDDAVATIIAFGTGGLYAMFTFTTGFALFARLTGRWNPALGELKLGAWGLIINILAFIWSLFELINIAWPRPYAISADAPWWQLWATPLVLGSILTTTTLYILYKKWLQKKQTLHFDKEFIMNQQHNVIWQQLIPGGCHWSGIVRRGTTLRLTDVNGGANAAVLFFNQEEKLERYNMADTLKSQHTFRLTKGHACHSDMGRMFCCITADTTGWNDTVCGLSDADLIQQKYGAARYQEHRNEMFRSGLDGMLIELGKWGLGMRDVVANINFFSKVTADSAGDLKYHADHSKAGDYVDLSFVMNTLVILSAAPHPLDPKKSYQPGAINLELFDTPPEAINECLHIAENRRALQNAQHFYCEGAK